MPSLPYRTLQTVLQHLAGDQAPAALPANKCVMYQCSNGEAFVKQMPCIEMWGLPLVGLEGPRENNILVAPVLAHPTVCALDVIVGGRTLLGTPRATAGEQTPPGAPEITAPEVPASTPEVAAGEQLRPGAPEAAASEAPTSAPEVAVCSQAAKGHAWILGTLHLNLGVLLKRKRLWSRRGDAPRPLKHRKYRAVDE